MPIWQNNMTQTHSVRQCPPAHGTDKLVGVVFLLVFVQDTLHSIKLKG